MKVLNSVSKTKLLAFLSLLVLSAFLTSCNFDVDYTEIHYVERPFPSEYEIAYESTEFSWYKLLKPDLVPINLRVCRFPEGQYVRWELLLTIQNQGGIKGLNVQQAPLDVYVNFDPDRPYGVDSKTGEPKKLEDYPDLLMDRPEQLYVVVPGGGEFGGASFNLLYPDGGPGSRYRRIPTAFDIFLDQMRGGEPGPVDESDETNNGVGVIIDRYDEISGYTGTYLIHCWYSE